MKFLFLSPVVWNFYPLQNQNLAKALAEKDFKVIYVEPLKYKNHSKNIRFKKLNKLAIPENLKIVERQTVLRKSFLVFIYENIKNTLEIIRNKPDVVICYDHLMGLLPCLYCFITKKKFFFNVSDDWTHVPQGFLARWVWKYKIKPALILFAHGIISISHKQYSLFIKKKKRTYLLPNGLANSFIENVQLNESASSSDTIIFIGNLRPWYNFELLFEVFSELPELKLHIYGTGPLLEELKKKAEKHPNIKLMGNVPHEQTPSMLKHTLIGIIPLEENVLNDSTSPVKLFDYWAAEKAVVATPTYEIKALGEDCVLFAQTKEQWVKQIKFLLANTERRKILGNTGFNKVLKTYNYQAIAEKFLEIIKEEEN